VQYGAGISPLGQYPTNVAVRLVLDKAEVLGDCSGQLNQYKQGRQSGSEWSVDAPGMSAMLPHLTWLRV
jgi:hypothetical protein